MALRRASFSKCCATQCQTLRETESKAGWGHFPLDLGLGVYGHGVCQHSLHDAAAVDVAAAAGVPDAETFI